MKLTIMKRVINAVRNTCLYKIINLIWFMLVYMLGNRFMGQLGRIINSNANLLAMTLLIHDSCATC